MKLLFAIAALAALSPSAWCQASDEPAQKDPPEEPRAAKAAEAPRVEIKERIEADGPTLARTLSDLLGAEVSIPIGVTKRLSLEAGSFKAREILDKVAAQFEGAWRQEFDLRASDPGKSPPECKLESLGEITLVGQLSLARAIRLIARDTGCKVKLPEVPDGFHPFRYVEMPAEKALEEVASSVGLDVWRKIVFELPQDPDLAIEAQQQDFLDQVMEQAEQKAQLSLRLEELTQQALDDPDFPWDSVLGFSSLPDVTVEEMTGLVGQLRAEVEMMRMVRELEGEQPFSPADGPGEPDRD